MDSKIEKKIEKEVGKDIAKEIKKEVDKEVDKQVKEGVKEVEKAVREEVEKKLHIKLYRGALDSARKFKDEFRNQIIIGITAAFAFLIALSWREPIKKLIDKMIESWGVGSGIYLEFLSALVITLLGVLVLMAISRWKSESE